MNQLNSRIISAIFKHLQNFPSFKDFDIDSYRKLLEKSAAAFPAHKSVQVTPFNIGPIPAQWVIPEKTGQKRIILYIHGGGYIAGSVTSHRDLGSRIAKASRARLLMFNYRLAPEHPFPCGFEDVKAVYHWLMSAFPGHRICLAGDSAGGGLALALLADLLEKKKALPCCTVLISPWIDLECKNASYRENSKKDPMLTPEVLKKTARLYTAENLSDPLISPVNNTFEELTPVLIQAGENEILLDDAKTLGKKLEQAGVNFRLDIWEGMFHVWHFFARYLVQGREAIADIGAFIEHHA